MAPRFTTINAPYGDYVGPLNAQGINNNGLIVGFYLGNDGQVHGFMANASSAVNGSLTGTPITDPTIPNPVEPGATFVFSQVLGINDQGIAVGYYGDSTISQHGYFYNTNTNSYTFLDDPTRRSITAWRSPRSRGLTTRARSPVSTRMPMGSFTASSRFRCPSPVPWLCSASA